MKELITYINEGFFSNVGVSESSSIEAVCEFIKKLSSRKLTCTSPRKHICSVKDRKTLTELFLAVPENVEYNIQYEYNDMDYHAKRNEYHITIKHEAPRRLSKMLRRPQKWTYDNKYAYGSTDINTIVDHICDDIHCEKLYGEIGTIAKSINYNIYNIESVSEGFFDNVDQGRQNAITALAELKKVIKEMDDDFMRVINNPKREKVTLDNINMYTFHLFDKFDHNYARKRGSQIAKAMEHLKESYNQKITFTVISCEENGQNYEIKPERIELYKAEDSPHDYYAKYTYHNLDAKYFNKPRISYSSTICDEIYHRIVNEYYMMIEAEARGIKNIHPLALKTITLK